MSRIFLEGKIELLCAVVLILFAFTISSAQFANAQTENWKKYEDPGKRFSFWYPPTCMLNSTHNDANGYTEVSLTNPNSSRMKVSLIYTPKDSSLRSEADKPVLLSSGLEDLQNQMSVDYYNFNSTGKFHHKYSIQNQSSASDVVDFEKIKGRPGKMLLIYSKASDTDSLLFTYTESKRSFYKGLDMVSPIIKSVSVIKQ